MLRIADFGKIAFLSILIVYILQRGGTSYNRSRLRLNANEHQCYQSFLSNMYIYVNMSTFAFPFFSFFKEGRIQFNESSGFQSAIERAPIFYFQTCFLAFGSQDQRD